MTDPERRSLSDDITDSNERDLFLLHLGGVFSNEGLTRVMDYFLNRDNAPSYHNEIFRKVGGSKTSISRALHLLSDEYGFLEKGYKQIPHRADSDRMVSVLMFRIIPELVDDINRYRQFF